MKTGQKVGYKRVRSIDQNTDRLLDGLELDKVFEDKVSGKEMTGKGVSVIFAKENLTFTGNDDAMNLLMLQIIGAAAQF